MKISVITTITNPDENQYPWREAIKSYLALADEVSVVHGDDTSPTERLSMEDDKELVKAYQDNRLRFIFVPWPNKWHWSELPVHLNTGLENATGDWVIKCDIDYVFHEKDIQDIRFALEHKASEYAVACFVKKILINRNNYYKKCRIPVAINKGKMGDSVKFGIDPAEKSDWCMPILVRGEKQFSWTKELKDIRYTNIDKIHYAEKSNTVPIGKLVPAGMVYDTGLNIYNYDCFFRTKEVQRREFWRFAQAFATAFNKSWGATEQEAWEVWWKMMKSRLQKQLYPMDISSHPKFITHRVETMKPEEFGYDNWGGMKQ